MGYELRAMAGEMENEQKANKPTSTRLITPLAFQNAFTNDPRHRF